MRGLDRERTRMARRGIVLLSGQGFDPPPPTRRRVVDPPVLFRGTVLTSYREHVLINDGWWRWSDD